MIAALRSVLAVERQKIAPVVGDDRSLLALRDDEEVGVGESAQLDSFLHSADVGSPIA